MYVEVVENLLVVKSIYFVIRWRILVRDVIPVICAVKLSAEKIIYINIDEPMVSLAHMNAIYVVCNLLSQLHVHSIRYVVRI